MRIIKLLSLFGILLLSLILILFVARAFSEKHLDDVSPGIPCDEALLKKADVFYVIPLFENKSISENQEWCQHILSFNKTLALHGAYHIYEEFLTDRDEEYLQKGINEFEKCFGFKPERFKPPQIAISENNKKLIKSKMQLDMTNIFHKAYHCSNTGMVSNKFVDIF